MRCTCISVKLIFISCIVEIDKNTIKILALIFYYFGSIFKAIIYLTICFAFIFRCAGACDKIAGDSNILKILRQIKRRHSLLCQCGCGDQAH